MYLGGSNDHHRVRRHRHRVGKDECHPLGLDHHHDASLDIYQQPESADSLRRQVAASLMRHHQSSDRNKHALQPLSPASYSSSLEIAPYNPAATPNSSIELRGRIHESNYSFKTSTELLKVLNRIWTLEEQHTSNVSLVKALKNELDHARCKIKELLRDQQGNRHEIDELVKQISEGNIARKSSKDEERIDAALLSVREELENERKLRKRSEGLHRRLARELFEVKVSLSNSAKDLEKERKANELLEELFDEFAKGIREYARQVHSIKQKSDNNWTDTGDHKNLLLHISESWLDEKMQVRNTEKSSIVHKLRPEIEAFIAAKKTALVRTTRNNLTNYNQQEEVAMSVRTKNHHIPSPSSVQICDPQNTPQEIDDGTTKTGEGTLKEISMLQKSEIYDALMKDGRKRGYYYDVNNNSKTVDKLVSELSVSEGGNLPPEYEFKEVNSGNSAVRRNASPTKQWMSNMKSPDPRISDSSKLHEPKSKEPKPRSKLKFLKGYS